MLQPIPVMVPQGKGYHDGVLSPEVLMVLCRNMDLSRDLPTRRKGYSVFRSQGTAVEYTERIPCDELDGTQRAVFTIGDVVYVDKATPSSLETLNVDPWGADGKSLPSWAYAYGRTVLVNGTDFRIYKSGGGDPVAYQTMGDAGTPTLSNPSGGSMTVGTWYVRIRYYDSATGTYSGPSQRLATAASQATSAPNASVGVDISALSPPGRATHWQIQLAMTTDTPSGYEIHYTPGDSTGHIPIGTTSATITTDPASNTRFPFLTTASLTAYRHNTPPSADFVCFHRGRWFYGSKTEQWVVWSDIGNPEHFYHDTVDENAGFNSALSDGIGNSLSGPLTGIFSNQLNIFFAQRGDIHMGSGSWKEVFDEDGVFVQRNAVIEPLAANGVGAVSCKWIGVDQEVYFLSPRGPAVIQQGQVRVLAPDAIRTHWTGRDRLVDHRGHVSYDPDSDLVLFSLITQSGQKKPDMILAWSRSKQTWCPPWNLRHSSLGLMRFQGAAGTSDRGLRCIAGSWSGGQLELGVSDGDGWDGASAAAAGTLPDSVSTTTATFNSAPFTADTLRSYSAVIVNPDGGWYYRQIRTNTTTTITWNEAISAMANNHYVFIGGIPEVWHTALVHTSELELRGAKLVLDDQPSRIGAA